MTWADILAQGAVDWMKAGGSPVVYLLAIIALLMIVSSVMQKSGQALMMLFIIFVATPIIWFDEFRLKFKKNQMTCDACGKLDSCEFVDGARICKSCCNGGSK